MLYATDIVKLDARAPKFMPLRNEDYPIFGERIYSPMEGEVVRVINDIDDNIPFVGRYPYNTGNTVVIRQTIIFFCWVTLKKAALW